MGQMRDLGVEIPTANHHCENLKGLGRRNLLSHLSPYCSVRFV